MLNLLVLATEIVTSVYGWAGNYPYYNNALLIQISFDIFDTATATTRTAGVSSTLFILLSLSTIDLACSLLEAKMVPLKEVSSKSVTCWHLLASRPMVHRVCGHDDASGRILTQA